MKLRKALHSAFSHPNKETLYFTISFILLMAFLIQNCIDIFSTQPPYLFNNALFHKNFTNTFQYFFNVNEFIASGSPYDAFHQSSYPPFNFCIAFFYMLVQKYTHRYVALTLLFFTYAILFVILLWQTQKKFQLSKIQIFLLATLFVFSTPVLFLLERANYVFFVFFCIALFLLWYQDGNPLKRKFALLFLAISVAMRMYPAIFVLLLLRERRFRDTVFCTLCSIFLFFIPFCFLRGGLLFNCTAFLQNLFSFASYKPLSINVSATNFFRITAYLFGTELFDHTVLVLFCNVLKIALLGISALAILFTKENWKAYTLCAAMIILIPNPAMVHSLIFLSLGIIPFLQKSTTRKIDYVYMTLFILLFMPLQFGYIIPFVPREAQYEGIQLDQVNYLGLATNTYLASFACLALIVLLIFDIFIINRKTQSNA